MVCITAKSAGIEVSLCVEGSRDKRPSCFCGKKHIDLRSELKWETQIEETTEVKNGKTVVVRKVYRQCIEACWDILTNAKLDKNYKSVIQVAAEIPNVSDKDKKDNTIYLKIDEEKAKEGLAYIDNQLGENHPVMVGVDYAYDKKHNEGTTDHFVVIVGRGCDNGKAFYYFYEVGTYTKENGRSDENKLYLGTDNSLRGTPAYRNSRKYTVSQVRRNKLL